MPAFWAGAAGRVGLVAGAGHRLVVLFAWLLTLVDAAAAGGAYAAYGGIYVVTPLAWLWAAEGVRPDRWDLAGAVICLIGAAVILYAPHRAPG